MRVFLLFTVLFIFAQLHAQDVQQSIDACKKKFTNKEIYSSRAGASNTYNITYHKIHWNIDPNFLAIEGSVLTHFVPRSSLSSLQFDLNDVLVVDSVIYHNTSIAFLQTSDDLLTVTFPSVLSSGVADSVCVYYHGVPVSSGMGSFVKDTTPADQPIIWTLSQPYGAKDWWPCKQDLQDKIDSMDVFIHHPSVYKGISNGTLVSESISGSNQISHWKHRYPIATYLVCLAVSDYSLYWHESIYGADTVKIANYVYPADSALLYSATEKSVNQMQLFDTLFGIYPFKKEKYGHVQFEWGGGMEHQTSTFIGNFAYEIVAHELAHHWFGDMATCGSWADIFLNEGFATYLSGLCYEHLEPMYWLPFKTGLINNIVSLPDGSVYCPDTLTVSRVFDARLTYRKGAMIIHTLRWVMGDSAFFAGLNNYLYDTSVYFGFSKMDKFISIMETAHGSSLGWYFNDWYYGEGYPSYTIDWYIDGANAVTFTVNQTSSHPSVSFYELPIPVQFSNGTNDTTIVFNHTTNGQVFTANLNFAANAMVFDPEKWIISANNTINGVEELIGNSSFKVYPTITTDFVFIKNISEKIETIEVYKAAGSCVKMIENYTGSFAQIDLSELGKGIYFVSVNKLPPTKIIKY